LREQVAGELRAAIMSGSRRPGVTHTMRTMAARFGDSPTLFSEAVRDLCGEGLLSIKPNRGFTVVKPVAATVVNVANVRRLLGHAGGSPACGAGRHRRIE
jgi:DNA-binding GntR family transcriptional regulator